MAAPPEKKESPSVTERVLALAGERGYLRPRDLREHGISRAMLPYLSGRGLLVREGRGLYRLPDQISENKSLMEAARLVPRGVVCLLSALRFHELGTQSPPEVWMALPPKSWRPRLARPWVRIVQLSAEAYAAGIEEHRLDGVTVRVYGPAKTVADCFKFRNKVGLDVALEALRDCLGRRKATVKELWRYAEIDRVARVMGPYLEAMV